ncbi:MAG: hypothetical protein IPN59_02775 [Holophaga sp.]|nr:hypothetical protein [Holophaga sp.]
MAAIQRDSAPPSNSARSSSHLPKTKDGAAALFAKSFRFVTNLNDAPANVVKHYLNRGEAERRFNEFVAPSGPTFRHRGSKSASLGEQEHASCAIHGEIGKNAIWAKLLALAHNFQVDLRAKVDGGQKFKPQPSLKPIKGEGNWSVLATIFAMGRVKPSMVRFRAFALKLTNTIHDHGRSQWFRLGPQHIRPAWAAALIAA